MHADKWGPFGAIFAALCALEFGPAVRVLEILALDFLVRDVVLIPALVVFLVATLVTLHDDRGYHGRSGPVLAVWPGALLAVGGFWFSDAAILAGLVLVLIGAAWNWYLRGRVVEEGVRRPRRVPRGPRRPR